MALQPYGGVSVNFQPSYVIHMHVTARRQGSCSPTPATITSSSSRKVGLRQACAPMAALIRWEVLSLLCERESCICSTLLPHTLHHAEITALDVW